MAISVYPHRPRPIWLLSFICVFATFHPWQPAFSFSLAPLEIQKASGLFRISNSLARSIRIDIKVYPVQSQKDGTSTISSTPLSDAEAEQLIRLRPSSFRLGSNAVRNVTYRLIDASTPARFYVCAETPQGITRLRICSRWAPSP